jgi:hypothetical protein
MDPHLTTLARSLRGLCTQFRYHNMVFEAPKCTHIHTAANQEKLEPLGADLLGWGGSQGMFHFLEMPSETFWNAPPTPVSSTFHSTMQGFPACCTSYTH